MPKVRLGGQVPYVSTRLVICSTFGEQWELITRFLAILVAFCKRKTSSLARLGGVPFFLESPKKGWGPVTPLQLETPLLGDKSLGVSTGRGFEDLLKGLK